jgi:TAG lipase/lysophosphatidylethanolamine acyltransferase
LASNASSTSYSTVILKCKDETGAIVPWASAHGITFRSWKQTSYNDRDSPLSRIAELFNVNHFVVSQARPYIAPFLRSDLHPNPTHPGKRGMIIPLLRLTTLEVRHRLSQLDSLGLLPTALRRLLIDESIPGASLTLVPDLNVGDFLKLLETPTKESLDYWILRGERSVWPAVGAMKVRCAIEVELDRCYQLVRRRKPLDAASPVMMHSDWNASKRRKRAASVGQG